MKEHNYLPSLYQQYIHLSRYSRWLPEKARRESWEETVKRYFDFFEKHLKDRCKYKMTPEERTELEQAVLTLKVMPSMRCLMTSGTALERDEVAGYNCSFLAVDNTRVFDEILYILCCGVGVGFSVERQFVNKLPLIAEEFFDSDTTIMVADSRIGWAKSLKELVSLLYSGQVPKWDLTKVRAAGAPLKTFGGRASGPEPLDRLFKFFIKTFRNASGRKLTSLECHDLICKIAEVVVVGGVRRSALISLSNLSDDRMRAAKSGQWWETDPQRALANNSAVYNDHPEMGIFMKEWFSLYESKSGERGIFNRFSAKKNMPERRNKDFEFGCNPCAEIILRSKQFCNLSSVVLRANDTKKTLKEKIRLAAILGTFQSTLDNFRYLSKEWTNNTKEERLLGISLNGILDCPLIHDDESEKLLNELKDLAVEVNKEYAEKLGIPQSTAITCVKPEGTCSQLVDCSSGIHPRYSPYYVRRVRMDKKDPLCTMMMNSGFPCEDDQMNPAAKIFLFPVKSPEGSKYRNDMTAIEQLELWKKIKKSWAEHTVSITVYVKENEWMEVGSWVYKNFQNITGISFLPYSDHVYTQAPYTDCTQHEYDELVAKMPMYIDWSNLHQYENKDMTTATHELACSGSSCDII